MPTLGDIYPSLKYPLEDEYIGYITKILRRQGVADIWIQRIIDTIRQIGWDRGGYTNVEVTNLEDIDSSFPLKQTVKFEREFDGARFSLKLVGKKWKVKEV